MLYPARVKILDGPWAGVCGVAEQRRGRVTIFLDTGEAVNPATCGKWEEVKPRSLEDEDETASSEKPGL